MYLPTSEEIQRCIKIVKKIKKIQDNVLAQHYAEETLKMAYKIGASYDDEMVLIRIIESL